MPLSKHASFRQLATFHAVARLGSVSLAADEMHLTQPAVSIQIGTLEESAGTPLLQRAQASGDVRPDTDIDDVMRLVAGVAGVSFTTEEQRQRVLAMAIDGLRLPP